MSLLQCNRLLQWNREREREREPSGHNKKVVEVTLNEARNKNTHQSSSSFYPCAIAQLAARPHPGPIHPTHIWSKPLNEPTNHNNNKNKRFYCSGQHWYTHPLGLDSISYGALRLHPHSLNNINWEEGNTTLTSSGVQPPFDDRRVGPPVRLQ